MSRSKTYVIHAKDLSRPAPLSRFDCTYLNTENIKQSKEHIIAVGHYFSGSRSNNKAELLNVSGDEWQDIDDYPFDKGI